MSGDCVIALFVCLASVVINIMLTGCIIKLYTDFVKTTVFTKKGGGI